MTMISIWVSEYCLMTSEQFFLTISWHEQAAFQWDDVRCVDMLLQSNTLSRLRLNQSLLSLLNLAEKQQILIL